jgi:acyl-CoA dehydrogenase
MTETPRLGAIRAARAAGKPAAIAHQVHAALGFTHDHRPTRRLWSWRDQFGN